MNRVKAALGSLGAAFGGYHIIDCGPDHPTRAAVVTFDLEVCQGAVTQAHIALGRMHRGAEELFETRDYRQILALVNRHDWQAPVFGELLLAELVEDALGMQIPVRAQWIRLLLAEQTRLAAHLAQLGFLEYRLGNSGAVARVRERLRQANLALTGNRVHPMFVRIGGVAADVPADWPAADRELLRDVELVLDSLKALAGDVRWLSTGAGLARLTPAAIDAHGIAGPAAAASGVDLDLRRLAPRHPYQEVDCWSSPAAGAGGDVVARFDRWLVEASDCVSAARAALTRLAASPPGGTRVRAPQVIRLPEGNYHHRILAPYGIAGIHLTSRGEKTPWRLRLRTPSFANVSALPQLLIGCPVDRLDVVIASLGFVAGDLEK